jgi:hypothetical protein
MPLAIFSRGSERLTSCRFRIKSDVQDDGGGGGCLGFWQVLPHSDTASLILLKFLADITKPS